MATAISDHRASRFQIIHLILALAIVFSAIMMTTKNTPEYQKGVQDELVSAKNSLEKESWEFIENKAKARHVAWVYDSGFYNFIHKIFIPKNGGGVAEPITDDAILVRLVNNMQILGYQVTFRVTLMEYWLTVIAPLTVCIVISGYYKWRRAKYKMGGASTGKSRVWLKIIWLLFIALIIVLIMPAILGSFNVYAPMIFMILLSVTISQFITAFHKQF